MLIFINQELFSMQYSFNKKKKENKYFILLLDEAVCIGPASSSESYLNIPNIIAAAEITNSDAIHPGYGFLAENANFSKICSENDIKFIGASPEMINGMGDKAAAKETMKKAGVPTIPGSKGIIETFEVCKKTAKDIGYPVMLKATAGGGGKGMRLVWKEKDLKNAWESAKTESKAAFRTRSDIGENMHASVNKASFSSFLRNACSKILSFVSKAIVWFDSIA